MKKHFEKGGEPDEELKTLNDMGSGRANISDDWLHKEELKANAVKWVKSEEVLIPLFYGHSSRMREDANIGVQRKGLVEHRRLRISFEVKEAFKIFFNLTEEDLK